MASNQYAKYNGLGGSGGSGGTVTSVGLALPVSVFTVSGSPVTTSGTLTGSFNTQTANTVLAGPTTGAAAAPAFRTLVAADLPTGGNLTDVGTDGIVITGGTGAVLGSGTSLAQHVADSTHNGYLSSTDWTTFNNKQGALTLGNLTDVGTDGITVTGGTGAVVGSGTSLSQHVADSTHNGYLSSTDWSTFNGKQASGNYITALTGDVTASGPGSVAATLATVNSNVGSFGSATQVGTFTVNGKGLITAAANTAIAIPFSQVSGTVPLNQGGTGQTTKAPAFDALSPMTTGGDLIYGGASGTGTRLANGSSGQFLKSNGTTTAPSWATITGTNVGYYNGYFVGSGSNYWSLASASYVDFTANGTIPSPTQLQNLNFGTVNGAASSLPGISFTAPFTGSVRIIVSAMIIPGQVGVTATMGLRLIETNSATVIDLMGQSIGNNSVVNAQFTTELVGYFNVTASSTYEFKLQGKIAGVGATLFIGAFATDNCLGITVEYVS